MKVTVQGKKVFIEDDLGHGISFTTEQLKELLRVLNLTFDENGVRLYKTLEFSI